MARKKWYAVRKGHRTGLCESWAECQAATTGYSGAQYKSFKTREEAQAYLTGSSGGAAAAAGHAQPADGGSAAAAAGGKFYAVASGRQIGIFDNWPQTKAAVEGFTNPVYKSFRMRQEAADFLAQYSSSSGGGSRAYGTVRGAADDSAGTAAKRQRGDSYQAPAPPPAFSGKQQQQAAGGQAPSPAAPSALPPQHLFVTTTFDGGSRNNPGRAGYGYAVFERERNERLRMGCRPLPYGSTNNEAEYSGLIAGMRYCLEKLGARHIVARGDSQLVVRQMTGQYRVNGERLLPLYREAKLLQTRCESFQIEHIYREENSLADLLSNLAMDSDAAVDRVVHRWQQGAGREELAALLAAGAQVDGHASTVNALRTAPCFMLAAAQLLAQLWDGMPVEEVTANLSARGWDEGTGGPPVEPLPLGTDSAAAGAAGAAGAGAGTSGVVAAAVAAATGATAGPGARGGRGRRVVRGRGLQAVPVAPVTLGRGWAQEVGKQEALLQQQQQPGVGGARVTPAAPSQQARQQPAAAAAGVAPRLSGNRPGGDAAAAGLAAACIAGADVAAVLQLQTHRQRPTWPHSSSSAVDGMPYLVRGQAELGRLGVRARGLQRLQQHCVLSRVAQHSSSSSSSSSSSALLRSSSSSGGSFRARAGRMLTAAAAAAAGRLIRREAGSGSSSSDGSRRQQGIRALAV